MTLEEILSSNVEIDFKLLDDNNITLNDVIDNGNLSEINPERYLSVLKSYTYVSNKIYLRFLIMYYSIKLEKYEDAYIYADYLYKNDDKYRQDMALYLIMLEEILGKSPKYNISISNVLVPNYDSRYFNTTFHNNIRKQIYNKEYEQAFKAIKKSFIGKASISESTIYRLLKAIKNKRTFDILEALENKDFEKLDNYFYGLKDETSTNKNKLALYEIWKDVVYGYPLGEPKEMPKSFVLTDAIEARDIDKVIKSANEPILSSLAQKIKEEENYKIVSDYEGNLSEYLYNTLESIYCAIQESDFESAQDIAWDYFETIGKDTWLFYIENMIFDLSKTYESKNDLEKQNSLASIFDAIVLASRSMTEEIESKLIEKLMPLKEEIHPYSKVNDIDIEYNYNIEGIDDIIEAIKNKTIDYTPYARKYFYTEDDIFKIAIMARENYRLGNKELGNTLLQIASNLTKESKLKSSELKYFIKAIEMNKDILNGKERVPFNEEVKMLLAK